jgi:hypothetical protein
MGACGLRSCFWLDVFAGVFHAIWSLFGVGDNFATQQNSFMSSAQQSGHQLKLYLELLLAQGRSLYGRLFSSCLGCCHESE